MEGWDSVSSFLPWRGWEILEEPVEKERKVEGIVLSVTGQGRCWETGEVSCLLPKVVEKGLRFCPCVGSLSWNGVAWVPLTEEEAEAGPACTWSGLAVCFLQSPVPEVIPLVGGDTQVLGDCLVCLDPGWGFPPPSPPRRWEVRGCG